MKKHKLLFLISLLTFTATTQAENLRPATEKQLAHDIYKQFIEVPSGTATGATTPVIEAAVAQLKAAGFTDEDIFVGGPNPRKMNLVVRYRGTGTKKPLLLLGHVDVVEAKRADWSMDPFKLTERDGYFYGRGTFDDKAESAILIANLIQLKKENFKSDRDIIVALTADEEGGSNNGVEWLLKNHKNLITAEYALNEGGMGEEINGKKISNDLQISEKYILNFRLEVRNKGGHSSLPGADNAIYSLAKALTRLSQFNFPLQVNPVTSAYFKALAQKDSGEQQQTLNDVANNSQAAMQKAAASSVLWNAMLRTTCVPTLLEGGHAFNALPQLAAVNINCRVLPDETPEYIQKTLEKVIDDKEVVISSVSRITKGPASPLNPKLITTVSDVSAVFWPNIPTIPIMITGATDGRFLRAAGIPTYGVMGLYIDLNDIRMHGRDERIKAQDFYEGQAFLYTLVKRLANQ